MPNTIPSVFDPKPMNTSPNFSEGADLLLSNFMSQSNATLLKNAETLTSCVHVTSFTYEEYSLSSRGR